jgi:hypothetical protein
MPTNNRRGNRGSTRRRSGANNKSAGAKRGNSFMGTLRGKPLATAAAVGGVVAAGVFLWSRRNELSDRITDLTNTSTEEQGSADDLAPENTTRKGRRRQSDERTQVEIAEEALTLKQTGELA